MLLTKPPNRDLDRYVFSDVMHARLWLSQDFVTDDRYEVAQVTARKRPCCGALYGVHILKRFKSIKEFMALTALEAAATSAKHPERRRPAK